MVPLIRVYGPAGISVNSRDWTERLRSATCVSVHLKGLPPRQQPVRCWDCDKRQHVRHKSPSLSRHAGGHASAAWRTSAGVSACTSVCTTPHRRHEEIFQHSRGHFAGTEWHIHNDSSAFILKLALPLVAQWLKCKFFSFSFSFGD